MKEGVIDHDIASLDATTLQVLKEPGRAATTKSYAYCFRGGPPDKGVVLYAYNHETHKTFVDQWFDGFTGSIHMDADPFFELLLKDEKVLAAYCNAHARRYFEKVAKHAKKQGLAHEAVRFYKKLYKIERQAKKASMSFDERYVLRQAESKPIMLEFSTWLDKHAPLTLPTSPLGKAFDYAIKYRDGLSRFIDNGRLEIDNNLTEQEIKPVVIARKNFMFANSMDGAHALCMHFSFIRTALLHKLDPYKYYVAIMKKIPHCKTVEDYEALLPWNIILD
jgi:transposase